MMDCMDCVFIVGGFIGCWIAVGLTCLVLSAVEGVFSTIYVIAKAAQKMVS